MRVKGIIEEDFANYKVPSMFINTCFCDFKCCTELDMDIGVCQNAPLAQSPIKEISDDVIYKHFESNPITKAVVVGGMEPMMQIDEIISLISLFRQNGDWSTFVVYTGYYPQEIENELALLRPLGNIVVKFGRFIPNKPSRHDYVLGINLSSDNQFADRIS
ncbi:4Fe-4S cluster-binding domain-containing protein [Flavonifractor plautii]|uniref:4Fe-4S cluster-binding domain-containing protein n=1 Tax=Flavonifractor plautii TaxID=292800 RepID=UPI001FACC814|nr:4Fe-4S cluster-binding domain-containing protein [Flavonifractor plautii]